MPRSKKAGLRGRGRGAHSNNIERRPPGVTSSSVLPADIGASQENYGYSLHSRAFNMKRDPSWDSDQKLRHTKVMFVSAGDYKRSEIKEPETGLAHMTLDESSEDLQVEQGSKTMELVISQDDTPSRRMGEVNSLFFIDTHGSEPINTGLRTPRIPPISPTLSSSSDEVIVFAGRDRAGKGLSKTLEPKSKSDDSFDCKNKNIENKICEDQILLAMKADQAEQSSTAQETMADKSPGLLGRRSPETLGQTYQQSALHMSKTKLTRESAYKSGRGRQKWQMKREEEQALIDDYISNMEAKELDPNFSFKQRDLGGSYSDNSQESKIPLDGFMQGSSLNERDRLDLGDFRVMSTSNERIESGQTILSKRNRKIGLQYLIVGENDSSKEARWVTSSSLIDVYSLKSIAEFEKKEKLLAAACDEEDDTDSGTDKDSTCGESDEVFDDDADLLQRKIDRMTDERIAGLLAKQEELGMGSSELLLFDDSPEADLDEQTLDRRAFESDQQNFRQACTASRPNSDFPTASRLADAYDGFDVMDFERPSLRKKPKGRKGRLVFDLSDSELETSMAMAWDKDRLRKRERKEEREMLRAQGLLGKKDTKPELKNRYKEGMGIDAVKDEIKNFLMNDNTTLCLPPMNKADRKFVHELANAFNLKSKSMGNGNKRFPVLYQTKRTTSFSEARFAAVESRLKSRFLPNMGLKGRSSVSVPKRSGQRGASNAAVNYRDGDVVGASAPELGSENKGRAMLERMGWSTGTALGAVNNKGILQPVSHVVKTTKAGLG